MRLFIVVLFLIFNLHSLSKADDIKDFEIEGMTLYQSALEYFSKSKIKNSEEDYYNNKKYTTATISSPEFTVYQDVQISYKTNDKNFVLLDISGIVDKEYNSCLKEIKTISEDFDKMFPDAKYERLYEYSHSNDKSGESKISDMFWKFDDGDLILLACYNWNTKYGKKKGYADELRVTISSKEFDDFLLSE
mgnify:CR=1 FL=1